MNSFPKWAIALIIFPVAALFVFGIFWGIEAKERRYVHVNDRTIPLLVADNFLERYRGLSGKETGDLAETAGMVFIFSQPQALDFSMRGMNFPLDFIWLKEGRVIKVDRNIQPPLPGQEPSRVSSAPLEADLVLEVPAGGAAILELVPGISVTVDRQK